MKKRFAAGLLLTVLLFLALIPVASASTYARVYGGSLRLRETPDYHGNVIKTYSNGTIVMVISEIPGWCYVQTPDMRVGYMDRNYLTYDITPTPTPTPYIPYYPTPTPYNPGISWTNVNQYARVYSANGLDVRMRSTPYVGDNVLGSYPIGRTAYVYKRSDSGWSYIRIDSKYGYMMTKYLNFGTSPDPAPSLIWTDVNTPGWITSTNGKGVNLRNSPTTTGANLIGVYGVGTPVTILKVSNGAWSYISVGGQYGYMMSKYLISGSVLPTASPAWIDPVPRDLSSGTVTATPAPDSASDSTPVG